jgi:hypothetical protein
MAEFTVVGVSTLNGITKVRYANSLARAKVLTKNGHSDVVFFEMPFSGHKEDAVDCILSFLNTLQPNAQTAVLQEAKALGFCV